MRISIRFIIQKFVQYNIQIGCALLVLCLISVYWATRLQENLCEGVEVCREFARTQGESYMAEIGRVKAEWAIYADPYDFVAHDLAVNNEIEGFLGACNQLVDVALLIQDDPTYTIIFHAGDVHTTYEQVLGYNNLPATTLYNAQIALYDYIDAYNEFQALPSPENTYYCAVQETAYWEASENLTQAYGLLTNQAWRDADFYSKNALMSANDARYKACYTWDSNPTLDTQQE